MSAPVFATSGDLRPLWPHQERGRHALRASLLSGCSRPVLMMATGAGKTRLAADTIGKALAKGKRVAFVVPSISLVDQAVDSFQREGIAAIGVMQADHWMTDADQPLQVISAQTLARRKRPKVDLVFVDECHLMFRSVLQWITDCPEVKFIGLSATPWARGMGRYYDDLISVATTKELVEQRILVPAIVYAPSVPDLDGVSVRRGEFDEAKLCGRMNTQEITGDVVQEWLARAGGRPTLLFAINRAHARHLLQRFHEAGIAAAYIDGATPQSERLRIFDAFARGDFKIIVNIDVLTAGVDLPFVSCIVDVRPTRSEIRLVQAYGRGRRAAPGKHDCLILDHAGNALRLGLCDEITHDALDSGDHREADDRQRAKREALPCLCEHCQAVIARSAIACAQCGAVREAKTAIQTKEEHLVKLGSGESGAWKPTISDKAIFFGEMRFIAGERGYSDGWASHKFRERFGVWPNDPRIRFAAPIAPSLKTKNWVRSRAIAFARGRATHG